MEDIVNKPLHYADTKYEAIDVMEDWGLDKCLYKGNALKYIKRAGKKRYHTKTECESEIIDLSKAVWYLQRKIDRISSLSETSLKSPK